MAVFWVLFAAVSLFLLVLGIILLVGDKEDHDRS